MGIEEQLGEIVIAPRVLEKIIAIATAKVEGVHSFQTNQCLIPFQNFLSAVAFILKTWTKSSQQISISTLSTE